MVPAEDSEDRARDRCAFDRAQRAHHAFIEEMTYVAKEMEREGFTVPLLIGGATTSRTHTAVKIAPSYHQPVIHVLDASRAVGVVGSLLNAEMKIHFTEENSKEQERAREKHSSRKAQPLLPFAEARQKRPVYVVQPDPPRPSFLGTRVYNPVPARNRPVHRLDSRLSRTPLPVYP